MDQMPIESGNPLILPGDGARIPPAAGYVDVAWQALTALLRKIYPLQSPYSTEIAASGSGSRPQM